MPQPIALPNYSHMAIESHEELIEEDIKVKAIDDMSCHGCRIRYTITGMANLEMDCCSGEDGGGYGDEMRNGGGYDNPSPSHALWIAWCASHLISSISILILSMYMIDFHYI
jgi:hypothetical protein